MKRTLKEAAADFQVKQDKRTLEVVGKYKTKTEAAEKLGISRQSLRIRLLRIAANKTANAATRGGEAVPLD